ncbi:MAG: TlpA disulfide reductase family protein [Pseudoxanthomonas sp.]
MRSKATTRTEPPPSRHRERKRDTIMRTAALGILLSALVQSALAGQPGPKTPALPESEFRQQMMLDGVKQVIYLDADGTRLDYDAFIAKVIDQQATFDKDTATDKTTATLKISHGSEMISAIPRNTVLAIPVASRVPALEHADLSGREFDLDNGKRYSLLSFYFAECAPCIMEIPGLNALKAQMPELQVVSITFDDIATAENFVKERGLQWPVVGDAQDFIDALGVKTYPTLVAVSPEGRLMGARSAYVLSSDEGKRLAEIKDWLGSLGIP